MSKLKAEKIFDKNFQQSIDRDTLDNYRELEKEDQELAIAALITYVLKYKKLKLPSREASTADFFETRHQAIDIFRKSKSRNFSRKKYLKIAAAASVLLVFGWLGYLTGNRQWEALQEEQAEVIEFHTSKGQQSEFTLPDGTLVALNYDSKLRYRITNDKDLQEVELEGEAFFNVSKDKSRTFRVITHDMNVNVLGTEFNVRAYINDLRTEATLLSGRIEVKGIANQHDPIILQPGESWSLNRRSGKYSITEVDTRMAVLWRDGEYYFDKISLRELANDLERMYKVDIHFQDVSLEEEIYSGSVYQDESITKFFEIINLTVPVDIRVEGSDIWLSRK